MEEQTNQGQPVKPKGSGGNLLWIVVLIAVVIFLGWWFGARGQAPAPTEGDQADVTVEIEEDTALPEEADMPVAEDMVEEMVEE